MSDAHEQYETQKAMGRLQRYKHGADTQLDDAEVRHNAIFDRVLAMRFVAPILIIAACGWWGKDIGSAAALSFAALWIALAIGKLISGLAVAISGSFRATVGIEAEIFVHSLVGVGTLILGLTTGLIGTVLAGATLLLTPIVWKRWARRVMANIRYSQMCQEPVGTESPRIME